MRAAHSPRYGTAEVLEIQEVAKPEPQVDEILVKVHAATVGRTDDGMLRGIPKFARLFFGFPKPKLTILGMEYAGIVEVVGQEVSGFNVGDKVFGMSPSKYGAHAQYICVSANSQISQMPAAMGFADVLTCEGVWYADGVLTAFGVKPGDTILIYGASGAIGLAALQLAKSYGAHVTAVGLDQHQKLFKTLGADQTIDYTKQDFTEIGSEFDFVLDAVGKSTYFKCKKLLKPKGIYSATDGGPWGQNFFLALWSKITKNNRVLFPLPVLPKDFIHLLKKRLESGEVQTIIDRTYPLEQIADAYRYVASEQKTGIVVIDMGVGPVIS